MPPDTQRLSKLSGESKRRIYAMLYWIAKCDNELHHREQVVLDSYALGFGLDAAEREALEQQVEQQQPLRVTNDPQAIDVMVQGMIEVVAADEWLDTEEEHRLLKLAEVLGVKRSEIEEALVRLDPTLRLTLPKDSHPGG